MAYIYPTVYPSFGRALRLYWEERNVSVTNNTSDIYWELQGYNRIEDSIGYYYAGPFTVTINGTVVANNIFPSGSRIELRNIDTARDTYVAPNNGLVASGTLTGVAHAADGSLTVTMSFSCSYIGASTNTCSGEEDVELTKIGRASLIVCNQVEFGFGEKDVLFKVLAQDPTFSHSLELFCAGYTNTYTLEAGTEIWKLTRARQNIIATNYVTAATSAPVTVTCTTYDGDGNQVGSPTSVTTRGKIPSQYIPTIDSLTYSLSYGIAPTPGELHPVQNYTTATIDTTVSSVYGATLANLTIKGHQLTYTEAVTGNRAVRTATSGTISSTKTLTYTVTVTDSRGRTTTGTVTLPSTVAWAPPSVSMTAIRCDSSGNADDLGSYFQATIKCRAAQLGSVPLRYNVELFRGSTSVQTWSNQMAQSQTLTSNAIAASSTSTYQLRVVLTLTAPSVTAEYSMRLQTASVTMDFRAGGRGVAFGGTASKDDTVQIRNGWSLEVDSGDLLVKNRNIYNAIYASTGDTITYSGMAIAGGMFNSAKSARFLIPLTKRVLTGVTVDVADLRIVYNGSTVGTSQDWVGKSGITITANVINAEILDFRINSSTALSNAVNYSQIAAWVTTLTLTVT